MADKTMNKAEVKPFLAFLDYHAAHGQSSFTAVCSKCGEIFRVYVWSFHGCGKKCPKCKQVYGRADLRQAETVKHGDRWVSKVGDWLYAPVFSCGSLIRWTKIEETTKQ